MGMQNWTQTGKGTYIRALHQNTMDLLKWNRDQLRWMVGLLTGHCHLQGHLFKLGLTDDPTCERCLNEDESATHILCDCEATSYCVGAESKKVQLHNCIAQHLKLTELS
jgi:hypothetical protein